MSINLTLGVAPKEVYDSSILGLVNHRHALGGLGEEYAEMQTLDLGGFPPDISSVDSQAVTVDLINGGNMVYRFGKKRVDVLIDVKGFTDTQFDKLRKLFAINRPLMFNPYYDASTVFSAVFAGIDKDGGLALIGDSQSTQFENRRAGDYFPAPNASSDTGFNGLTETLDAYTPKLTKGMINNAILLERQNIQYANSAGSWAASGGAVVGSGGKSVHNDLRSDSIAILASGSQYVSFTTVTGLTNGLVYHFSIAAKGNGVIRLGKTDSGGTTYSDGFNLDPTEFRVFHFAWVQNGTSAIPLLTCGNLTGCTAIIGPPHVDKGYTPTCYGDSGITLDGPDSLLVDSEIPYSGASFSFWYKYRESVDICYFVSWQDGSSNRYIRLSNGAYAVMVANTTGSTANSNAIDGEWTQLVVTVGYYASGATAVCIYENGTLLNATNITTGLTMPIGDSGFYIGSSIGNGGTAGLDMPLDRVRIDARQRTAAEILNEYDTLSALGLRGFLGATEGRLYALSGLPGSFVAGLTSRFNGQIRLSQIGYIETAAV